MTRIIGLHHWQAAHTNQIIDTRYAQYDPRHRTNLTEPAYGGWTWQRGGRTYRTDGMGHGLWLWTNDSQAWQQVEGSSQFELPDNRTQALKEIHRQTDPAEGYF